MADYSSQLDRQDVDGLITPEMAIAGRKALAIVADRMEEAKLLATSSIDFWQRVGHEPANEIYRAMVAATPPSSKGAEGDIARSIATIENAFNFVSDAVPLKNCGEWKYLKRLVAEQLQSAPDAMREALIIEITNYVAWTVLSEVSVDLFDRIIKSLSAPVPSPDALRQNADRAHDKLYGFAPSPDGAGGATIQDAIAVLEALQAHIGRVRDRRDRLTAEWANLNSRSATLGEAINAVRALSPSGTGAAEPVRDLFFQIRDYLDLNSKPENDLARKYSKEISAILAAPPVRGDRETIAKIINCNASISHFGNESEVDNGLYLADLILSAPVSGRDAVIEEWQDIASAPKDQEVEVRGIWKLRGDGIVFTHWRALSNHKESGR